MYAGIRFDGLQLSPGILQRFIKMDGVVRGVLLTPLRAVWDKFAVKRANPDIRGWRTGHQAVSRSTHGIVPIGRMAAAG